MGLLLDYARKNNWVEANEKQISIKTIPSILPGEKTLKQIGSNTLSHDQIDRNDLSLLMKRPDFIIETYYKGQNHSL